MIPNIITIAALISGLTALRYALDGRWAAVVGLITLAAIFDALDGRTARMLRATSAFGKALDSLSDVVVFGVIPGLCMYLWALQDQGNLAWAAALFYVVCIALRLARFDSEIPDKPDFAKDFFTGIPTFAGKTMRFPSYYALPALAIIALLVGLVVVEPWAAYLLLAFLYVLTIPIGCIAYLRRKHLHQES